MENKIGWVNATLIFAGITSFILGFVGGIDEGTKMILFLASPALLAISCLFIFLKNQDDILLKLSDLEEKLIRAEDLKEMKADVIELKRRII